MAAPGLVLVHSPLLGAFSWREVAARLQVGGYATVVPDFTPVLLEPPPLYPKIARAIAKGVEEFPGDIVLVGHSGAGALLPAIAMAVGTRVRGLLFVDAILPHPGQAWMDTVPAGLAEHLRARASDGFLPPWHEWWQPQVMADLLPNDSERQNFIRNLRQHPFAYLEEIAPEATISQRCAYLQLSSAYETEAKQARDWGWPVEHYPLGHLAMVSNANALANCIQKLVGNFGV